MNEFPSILILWSGLGLIGSLVLLSKSATPERTIFVVILSIPHAIVFGPIFLLIALAGQPQQQCPYCQSSINRIATVCAKCTRDLPA